MWLFGLCLAPWLVMQPVTPWASPIDRLILGQAAHYPADASLRARLPELQASPQARRQAAWEVVARVLAPVALRAPNHSLPRFATWYGKDDVLPMFDSLLRALPPEARRARAPFTFEALAAVFFWNAQRAPTLPSWSEARYAQRLADLRQVDGPHALGQVSRTLMSPAVVEHLLRHYKQEIACQHAAPAPTAWPTTPGNHATCFAEEFPLDAVVTKLRWIPGEGALPTYDTSPAALHAAWTNGPWGDGDGQAIPDANAVYTMHPAPGETMRLAGLHVVSKELRDWLWISLWWSPEPNSDFGADRPSFIADLGEVWTHYKMCVVTDYRDGDAASWCSNPYLELGPNNAATNCIGCHQHAGTDLTTPDILGNPDVFLDHGRSRVRRTFPADYLWVLTGQMELGAAMQAHVDALTWQADTPEG